MGADINAPDERNFTPVFVAFKGHVESARMLLERGAVIDIRNRYGETPLHQALRWEDIELVRLFLEHGADPSLANRCGKHDVTQTARLIVSTHATVYFEPSNTQPNYPSGLTVGPLASGLKKSPLLRRKGTPRTGVTIFPTLKAQPSA